MGTRWSAQAGSPAGSHPPPFVEGLAAGPLVHSPLRSTVRPAPRESGCAMRDAFVARARAPAAAAPDRRCLPVVRSRQCCRRSCARWRTAFFSCLSSADCYRRSAIHRDLPGYASLAEGGNARMPVFEGAEQTKESIEIAARDRGDLLQLLGLVLEHTQHLKKREQPAHPMQSPGFSVQIQTMHRIPRAVVAPPRYMIRRIFVAVTLDLPCGLQHGHCRIHVHGNALTHGAQAVFDIDVLDEVVFPERAQLAIRRGRDCRTGRDDAQRGEHAFVLVIDAETPGEIFAGLEDWHALLKIDLVDLRTDQELVGTEFAAGLHHLLEEQRLDVGVLVQQEDHLAPPLQQYFSSPVVGTGETPSVPVGNNLDALLAQAVVQA